MKRLFLVFIFILALLFTGCFGKKDKPKPQPRKPANEATKEQPRQQAAPKEEPITGFSKEATIQRLKNNLSSKDPKKRAHAALGMAFHQNPTFVDEIIKLLNDKSPMVVKAAIQALGVLEATDALNTLYNFYAKSEEVEFRVAVLKTLQYMQNDDTQRFIMRFLPEMSPAESIEALKILSLYEQEDDDFSEENSQDLESFTISGVIGAGTNAKVQIDREFFGKGDTIYGYKITAVNPRERVVSLEKDGQLFSKEIDDTEKDPLEKAVQLIKTKEDKKVYQGLIQLIKLQDNKPADEVIEIASGKYPNYIRLTAIYTIGVCMMEKGEETLKNIISKDRRSDFLISATVSLAQLGNENAIDVITPLATNPNPWVRNAAIYGVGYFQSQHTIGTLVGALDDDYAFVRTNAYNQLVVLAESGYKSAIAAILSGYLEKMTPIKQALIGFLQSVPGGMDLGGNWGGTTTKAGPVKPKEYKPGFIIVGFGNWSGQQLVTVIDNGQKKNLTEGKKVEGKKILMIDSDDESMEILIPETKKIALIIAGKDEETPAEIIETRDAK